MKSHKIATAFAFKFIERVSAKSIGLVISIILARLLAPETFGLLAIITVFINLAQVFVHSGLSTALVQNRTTTREDYSTVFFFSLGIAAIFCVLLFMAAPWIAAFYKNQMLIWPIRAMSLSLPIGALNSVQNAKLQREMKFQKAMYCNLAATVIAGTIGVAAAYAGAELWALVIYQLSSIAIVTVIMLLADNWHPQLVFSYRRMKLFWSFSWKMLVSGLLCSLYNDIRSLIIAKRFSAADLAVYNKGQQFPDIIAHTMDSAMQAVMLPVMSEKQDSQKSLNEMLLKTQAMSMLFVAPVMLGLAAVAETLIPFLLTEKWSGSIPYLIIFGISYLTLPIGTTNLNLVKAMGRGDMYMKAEFIRRAVMLVVLLITVVCFRSVFAIAISFLVSSVLDILIILATVKRLTGLRFRSQFQSVWKTLLAGAVMFAAVHMMNVLTCGPLLKLAVQVVLGIAVYTGCVALLRTEPFLYLLQMAKSILTERKE